MPNQELTVRQELEQLHPQFKQALIGTGIAPEKFILTVTTALRLNPDLRNCDRRSLLNAAMRAATDGLLPDGHQAALVPFDGKVTYMPMIAGIRTKVRRTGEVTSWDVTAVHQKDKFDYELGDSPWIKHKPWNPPPIERGQEETEEAFKARLRRHVDAGPLTHVYSVATIKGGDKSRDVMSRTEVELVKELYARKNKKGEYPPSWRKSFDEMAKKTIARRHGKQLPMSSDVVGLLSRDDGLYDLERARAERVQAPRELSARLDFLAGVDPETGEFPASDDGASTPPSEERAVSDDASGGRNPEAEGTAQPSGADFPVSSGERDGYTAQNTVTSPPEPETIAGSGSQAPPGAAQTPSRAPGGSPRKARQTTPDLLTRNIATRGDEIALQGRQTLERWVNDLPPDEMAKISLAQLKAWRGIADKVGV